jgi:hypothetical protein
VSRTDSVKETTKARTVARILLAGERAVEPVVSQARTAGRAFRVWQIQRQIDADVDALSANKQENLGRHLARTDGGGGEAYDDLAATDSDAADALIRIQDPLIERQFVNAYRRGEVDDEQLASALRRYDGLDANKKQTADELIDETGANGVKLRPEWMATVSVAFSISI